MATLAFGFKISVQQGDLLFFSFMLIIAIVSFSEDFLAVDKGIIYYAFFYSFFIFSDAGKMRVTEQQKEYKYSIPRATKAVIEPSLL
jgi:hypothetical protein